MCCAPAGAAPSKHLASLGVREPKGLSMVGGGVHLRKEDHIRLSQGEDDLFALTLTLTVGILAFICASRDSFLFPFQGDLTLPLSLPILAL